MTLIFNDFLASSNPAMSLKVIFYLLVIKKFSIPNIKSVSGPSPSGYNEYKKSDLYFHSFFSFLGANHGLS